MSDENNTSNENNTNTTMNTVGIVVLENEILKFKRFGAALKRKIKLGTAAFMNVVNNATTTEEGFVPDARVVAQQQTEITELQTQVQSLNSASLQNKGTVTNIDNLSQGIYRLSNFSINGTNVWGTLFCFGGSGDFQQLFFGNYGYLGALYRSKNNSVWSGWKAITMTNY